MRRQPPSISLLPQATFTSVSPLRSAALMVRHESLFHRSSPFPAPPCRAACVHGRGRTDGRMVQTYTLLPGWPARCQSPSLPTCAGGRPTLHCSRQEEGDRDREIGCMAELERRGREAEGARSGPVLAHARLAQSSPRPPAHEVGRTADG